MRIALVNADGRKVGGIETYLGRLLPALLAQGDEVALLCERDRPMDRCPIAAAGSGPIWCVEALGAARALESLRQWRPDVLFAHAVDDLGLEEALLAEGPAARFAHGYVGTCISGAKSFRRPAAEPCARRFGWPCLACYYPRGCGGWDPITMWRLYREQSRRLALLRRYGAILVASPAMAEEYWRHRLGDRVHAIRLPISPPSGAARGCPTPQQSGWRLLFMGRIDRLKGGQLLLEALPQVCRSLDCPITATFAGDGEARSDWERLASRVRLKDSRIRIEFLGWVNESQRDELFRHSHLLVVPSVWPEPFGQVGIEAAHYGVPAVGFAVGGISSWLSDGVNGCLASSHPPTAEGLAVAIGNALREPGSYQRLCQGALEATRPFTLEAHLGELMRVLRGVAGK